MLTFSEENHIKSIFHLSTISEEVVSTNSIAENLNTKASSVTEMLKKLSEKSLIVYKKYHGAQLTELGRKTALNIIDDFSDKYFWSLSTTSDIFDRTSHSQYLSNRAISIYSIAGLLLFYGVVYFSLFYYGCFVIVV